MIDRPTPRGSSWWKTAFVVVVFTFFALVFSSFWLFRSFGVVPFASLKATYALGVVSIGADFVWSFLRFSVGLPAIIFAIVYAALHLKQRGSPMLSLAVLSMLLPLAIAFTLKVNTDFFRSTESLSASDSESTEVASLYKSYTTPETLTSPPLARATNLVWIVAESLEREYLDPRVNSELTAATEFMESLDIYPMVNRYTVGSLLSMRCGAPLFLRTFILQTSLTKGAFTKARCLDDYLRIAGYKSYFIAPHDPNFSGLGPYFAQHANAEILYPNTAENRRSTKHDVLPDEAVYAAAISKINSIPANTPFSLTILTMGNHAPRGFPSNECRKIFGERIFDVIRCNNHHLAMFVAKIRQSHHASNTAIVITGDHAFMGDAPGFSESRRVFAKIFSPNMEKYIIRKQATQFDLFPTTLAALGFDISNKQVGIGFSAYDVAEYPDTRWLDKINGMNFVKPPDSYHEIH